MSPSWRRSTTGRPTRWSPASGPPTGSSTTSRERSRPSGSRFDEWFSQASIEESEAMDATIAELERRGVVFEEDGALWLDSGRFGDPREKRVLRRSPANGGTYTYLAGDIAYHRDKFVVRGFDRVINVWGADHAAQIASLKAGIAALGVDPGRLEVETRPAALAGPGAHVEAGGQRGGAVGAGRRHRARGLPIPQPHVVDRQRHDARPRPRRGARRWTTPCTTSRWRTPGSPASAGPRPRRASSGCPLDRGRPRRCSPTSVSSTCCARCRSCPTSCSRPGPSGRRTRWPRGCASWPAGSTASTTTATSWGRACRPS